MFGAVINRPIIIELILVLVLVGLYILTYKLYFSKPKCNDLRFLLYSFSLFNFINANTFGFISVF